jgi:hypothetical protein
MESWWYVNGSKKIGPVDVEKLQQLMQKGSIDEKVLVWKDGFDEWKSIDSVLELDGLRRKIPPPLPLSNINKPAGRWSRFIARSIDLSLETSVVAFILGFCLEVVSSSNIGGERFSRIAIISFISLPIGLLLDASIYSYFGNTPGKALLRLNCYNNRKRKLSLWEYIRRNFSMWGSGLSFGLPILSIFALLHQFVRLGSGSVASYDVDHSYQVLETPTRSWRLIVSGILLLGVVVTPWFVLSHKLDLITSIKWSEVDVSNLIKETPGIYYSVLDGSRMEIVERDNGNLVSEGIKLYQLPEQILSTRFNVAIDASIPHARVIEHLNANFPQTLHGDERNKLVNRYAAELKLSFLDLPAARRLGYSDLQIISALARESLSRSLQARN